MKNIKKVVALLVAALLVVSMMSSFAEATNYTITLPSTLSGATYNIYQILTGKYSTATGEDTLSDLHWGSSTAKSGDELTQDEIDALEALADGKPETARTLYNTYVTGSAYSTGEAAGAKVEVPEGYYLVEEILPDPAEGEEQSLFMVKVVKDVTMTRKAGTTTSEKTVDDVNDSTGDAENGQKSADYDIGDDVPFHVTATIAATVGNYPKYHITMEDILESGKFDDCQIISVKLDGEDIEDTENYTATTTWDTPASATGFKVTFEFTPEEGKDLSSLAGKVISIDFTAKLGEGAATRNENTLKVSYSNNPNNSDGKDEGETPEDKAITFTYKVVVDKTDGENPLPNAGFTLYKIYASHNAEKTGDSAAQNDAWAEDNIQSWELPANGDTTFTFNGVDDGWYVLCETVTPSGYNTMKPVIFEITATHTSDAITELEGIGTIDVSNGTMRTSVENKSGATLPETGGIGTTIFYVAGSIMVLAAAILLVTKRRMTAED